MADISFWLLSRIVAVPVLKHMLKLLRNHVIKSIDSRIQIETGDAFIGREYSWFPIIFGLKIISRTPTRLRIVSIEYHVRQNGESIQFVQWPVGSEVLSNGYRFPQVTIEGEQDAQIFVALNPRQLNRLPTSNTGFNVSGTIGIDSGFGVITRKFETDKVAFDFAEWQHFKSEFEKKNA